MTATLTYSERRVGLALSVLLTLLGFAMAAAARQGVMSVHGFMALALGLGLAVRLGARSTIRRRRASGCSATTMRQPGSVSR
ncbi:hypothetical protein ACFSZS_28925 [Seohaeicola zhoushanensis]